MTITVTQASWTRRLAAAGVLLGIVAGPARAQVVGYTYHELSIPPGFNQSRAFGINNLDEVVGWVASLPYGGPYLFDGAVWDAQAPMLAPASQGGFIPAVINDTGEMAGKSSGTLVHWSPSAGFTALADVNTPVWRTNQSAVVSLSNTGKVLGNGVLWSWAGFANGPCGLHWNPPTYAPVIQNPPGGLDVYGFTPLTLHAANDLDQLVGHAWLNGLQDVSDAFHWDAINGYEYLSLGAAGGGSANDINGCEQTVGFVRFTVSGASQAVLWEKVPGGFASTLLPGLPGANPAIHDTSAVRISEAGQIVGFADDANGTPRPVLWELTPTGITMSDLSAYLPPPNPLVYSTSWHVVDVSNNGYILGNRLEAMTPSGPVTWRSFVLAPGSTPLLQCAPPVPPGSTPPFTLLPLQPGMTGSYATVKFTVVNATPGTTVHFIDDTTGRFRLLNAVSCPYQPPAPSVTLGTAVADLNGEASYTARFPSSMSGQTREYVAADPAGCVLDAQVFTHP